MTATEQFMGLTARPLGRRYNGAGCEGEGGRAAVGSLTGAAGEGGRWSAAVGSPTGAPGGGWRVGGQPWDSPLLQSRQGGARGARAGAGGREVHLCGAPSGLPLLRFCEWKHLQMCSGGR